MSPKLLIVDDEPDVELLFRQIYRRKLRSGEIEPVFASDGVEALERLETDPEIAAVFTDINMPRMNGLALLAEIQKLPREIPVVVVSAYGDMQNIRTAMNRGAFDFLTKPVDFKDLETTRVKVMERVDQIASRVEAERRTVDGGRGPAETAGVRAGPAAAAASASSIEVAAGMAHEIRNPLNFILSFARLSGELLEELREKLAEAGGSLDDVRSADLLDLVELAGENVGRIHEHGTRAESIISSMLGRAKGLAGKKEATDVNALLDDQLALAEQTARSSRPDLEVAVARRYETDLPLVHLDPLSVARALLIVLNNAYDAVSEKLGAGGDGYRPQLSVSTSMVPAGVEIRVRDNGTGIAEGDMARIFLPRFSTKHESLGVGIGLALCYDVVVNQHGGDVYADSVDGEFAEFIITLPVRSRGGA